MSLSRHDWYCTDGPRLLRQCGIRAGFRVLDFGARVGYYTIPLARIAGTRGRVYAFDLNRDALARLRRKQRRYGLDNIETAVSDGTFPLPWPDGFFDAVLAFDVIQYFADRTGLYGEVRRVLKAGGYFPVYPKHTRDDLPSQHLADRTPEDIVREIAAAGFSLRTRVDGTVSHDNGFTPGRILNFIKTNQQ